MCPPPLFKRFLRWKHFFESPGLKPIEVINAIRIFEHPVVKLTVNIWPNRINAFLDGCCRRIIKVQNLGNIQAVSAGAFAKAVEYTVRVRHGN